MIILNKKGYDFGLHGTIIKGIGGLYFVKAEDSCVYECKARGIFRKEKIKPMIGDSVEIELDNNSHGFITDINERKTSLIRPPVANIDTLFIVCSVINPEPDYLLADKLILMSKLQGITPCICITKKDLQNTDEIKNTYINTGFKIFEVSSKTNEGLCELKSFLKGKTTALAGLSGVGKSSLLQLLVKNDIKTGDISKINRGKHTTRHIELFELEEGGFVFDTPGFSSFETERLNTSNLCDYYPEMLEFNEDCRFKGCSHINEPDCAVKKALENGLISKRRYDNYTIIYQALKEIKEWEK